MSAELVDLGNESLPPEVTGLSAVSLFNDFASEMVYPLLPAFVTGPLGGNALVLGALDGAADLTAALVKWITGRLADRPGWSRPLILVGYGVAVLVRPLMSVAGAAWQVVGFRVVDRVGKGLRGPPRDALIAEVTVKRVRGRAFGLNRAADHLGAVLGSLTAWVLLQRQADLRAVIGWSAVPGLLALLVLLAVLRSARVRRVATADRSGPGAPTGVTSANSGSAPAAGLDASGAAFWTPVLVLVLLTVARLPETLLLLRLQELGVPVPAIPLAWAGLHVVRSASSYPGGWLGDRVGAGAALALGTILYAAAIGILATGVSTSLALVVFLAHGLVAGLVEPAEKVAVARLAPRRTGTGFGNAQGLAGIAALPAGLAFGWIYRGSGGAAALMVSAISLGLIVPVWLLAARRLPPG